MDQLPQELVDRICRNLEAPDLKNTLLLSRKFQFSSEKYSGRFTRRVLRVSTAQKFIDTYSGHRLIYLQEVEFRPTFARLRQTSEKLPCRESEDDIRQRDESFSQQIQLLFNTLKTVEERAGRCAPGRLRLALFSPTRMVDSEVCLHRRYVSWRVHLLAVDALPKIHSIRAFEVYHGTSINKIDKVNRTLFKLDYRVLIDLAAKFPSLEYLSCNIGGDEWGPPFEDEVAQHFMEEFPGPHRDTRHDFAKALETVILPKTLRKVQLDFLNPLSEIEGLDQRRSMPNLVDPASRDPFSSSISLIARNLRKLQLRVVADESLFSDSGLDAFANIESLDVMFHPMHPSGSWYFQGPQGEGADTVGHQIANSDYPPLKESDAETNFDYLLEDEGDRRSTTVPAEFRIVPIDDILVPLFTAFAKAAATMTKLKEAALWSYLMWEPGELDVDYEPEDLVDAPAAGQQLGFGLQYLRPREKVWYPRQGEDHSASRQIWWSVAKWRPDATLHALCQDIGRRNHGDELVEYWTDPQYGECLVYQDRFMGMNVLRE